MNINLIDNVKFGAKIALSIKGHNVELSSSLIGLLKGNYIIVQIPLLTSLERAVFYENLYAGNSIYVKMVADGQVIKFESKTIKYITSPYPLIFITFPVELATHNLRRHPRVPCLFKCLIHTEAFRTEGIIANISKGGCLITIMGIGAINFSLSNEQQINLECPQLSMSKSDPGKAVIRRVHKQDRKVDVGIEFDSLNGAAHKTIDELLNFVL